MVLKFRELTELRTDMNLKASDDMELSPTPLILTLLTLIFIVNCFFKISRVIRNRIKLLPSVQLFLTAFILLLSHNF